MNEKLSLEIRNRTPEFDTHSLGESLDLYRGDKIGKTRFISRGGENAGKLGKNYIDYVKYLLELPNTNNPKLFLELKEFFPGKLAGHITGYIDILTTGQYQTWSDFFIELHTSKTILDPFVSVTNSKSIANQFSQNPDESIYHVRVKATRILNDHFNRGKSNGTEFFVFGAVDGNEIIE